MTNPNTPLRMASRGNGTRRAEVDTQVSGSVACDGFDRLAHRKHPGAPPPEGDSYPFSFGAGDDRSIKPRLGKQEFRFPPYAEE